MIISKVNESILKISDIEYDESKFLSEQFSFYADNYRFHPKHKMKKWDGKIRLYNSFNSTLPVGLFNKLTNILNAANFDYKVKGSMGIDIPLTEHEVNNFVKNEMKCELNFRDYQTEAFIDMLGKNRCVGVLPTSSGKSLLQYMVINYLLNRGYVKNCLLIVPTVNLVNQMEYDFLDYASNLINYKDKVHKIYSGEEKDTDKPITISTWQTLQNFNDEKFSEYDLVMVDECHESTAKELSRIVTLCHNSKFKYGVSGSLEDTQVHLMQLEALFGVIKEYITTKELTDKNIVTKATIYNLVLKYDKEEKKEYNRLIKQLKNKHKDGDIGAKGYFLENEFITTNDKRKHFILKTINKCKGNTLILFKNVEYGRALFELSKEKLNRNVYFIYGDVKPEEREKIRLMMEEEEDAIVFATLKIFSTGINIKKLEYVVFSQNVKSKIKVIQSIGRSLRKHKDKSSSKVIDIIDDINGKNYSVKHAMSKLELYDKQQFDYKIKEFNLQ